MNVPYTNPKSAAQYIKNVLTGKALGIYPELLDMQGIVALGDHYQTLDSEERELFEEGMRAFLSNQKLPRTLKADAIYAARISNVRGLEETIQGLIRGSDYLSLQAKRYRGDGSSEKL